MDHSIASNADQFKQSFREEAREIVVDLESALLELNENRSDLELVSRAFRGLHTLKGSGAMFGFEKLAAFTHNLETAFDQVRSGRLEVSSGLIDLTLEALDLMRAMIEEDEAAPIDPTRADAILSKLRALSGVQNKPAETSEPAAPVELAHLFTGPVAEWRVGFAPDAEMMLTGANPLLLLRELRQLGGLSVRACMSQVPPLADLEPERCYVTWEMVLATSAGLEAIRDVFIFVEDHCKLTIEPAARNQEGSMQPSLCSSDNIARSVEDRRSAAGGRRSYDKADNATSLRVPASRLDHLVDLVGELVTVQARLGEVAARCENPEVAEVSEEMERLTSALRESSMNIRMTPIRSTFEKFRRLVHDLARDLGKDVELTMEGVETELDKTVIDQLSDPLMHLIRNSMDHGVETAAVRMERGKRPTATVHLSARYSGASVLVGVADDGAGIDADAVRSRAIEKGLVPRDAVLSESETFSLIFQPGFSTAQAITDVSGRGVGMDVVRQRVESLRGSIELTSKAGEGTQVVLRLPLTLAIIDGILLGVGGAYFVLPLSSTLECIELTCEDVERANGKHLVTVRGELIPYVRLRQHFAVPGEPPPIEQIVVVETSEGRLGLVVDEVLGNCQTVIKSLGRLYRHVQAISGATILGNGMVALILDPERLTQDAVRIELQRSRARPARQKRSRQKAGPPQAA